MAVRTVEQLFRHRNVVGVRSRIKEPATPMSTYYGVSGTKGREYSATREGALDLFNHTRLMPKVRAPKTAPGKVRRAPVAQMNFHLIRLHEEVDIFDEDIMKYRPPGGSVGQLDTSGQIWVAKEVRRAIQRHGNGIEFMFSRMLRGGFGVKKSGEDYSLIEEGGSGQSFPVDYPIPATNVGNVDGIFTALWSTSSTDIIEQFLNLNAMAERVSGYPVETVWINSVTLGYLYDNTVLRSVQGTYVRLFDIQDGRQLETIGGPTRKSGYVVKFTALPNITFIVCDVVQQIDQEVDSTTAGNSSKIIPDGRAIMTPAPGGDWYGMLETDEPVREFRRPESVMRRGFYSWRKPFFDPPGQSLATLDNVLPVLWVPAAVYYATIA